MGETPGKIAKAALAVSLVFGGAAGSTPSRTQTSSPDNHPIVTIRPPASDPDLLFPPKLHPTPTPTASSPANVPTPICFSDTDQAKPSLSQEHQLVERMVWYNEVGITPDKLNTQDAFNAAYQVEVPSFPVVGASGITYGASQQDLGQDPPHAREVFACILNNTKDISGLDDKTIAQINAAVKLPGDDPRAPDAYKVVSAHLEAINKAAQSPFGVIQIRAIDDWTIEQLTQQTQDCIGIAQTGLSQGGVLSSSQYGSTAYKRASAEIAEFLNMFNPDSIAQLKEFLAHPHSRNGTPEPLSMDNLNGFIGTQGIYAESMYQADFETFIGKATDVANATTMVAHPAPPPQHYRIEFSEYDGSRVSPNSISAGARTVSRTREV